jgi:mRNA-degrading endonuclease RelE of RelBE toxin-antitoxin system
MKVIVRQSAEKQLAKINKADYKSAQKIKIFLRALAQTKQPKSLPNGEKMKGYDDRYRWRVGNYRVIGIVKDKELLIEIIKISTREGAYKGGEN